MKAFATDESSASVGAHTKAHPQEWTTPPLLGVDGDGGTLGLSEGEDLNKDD